MKHILPDTRHSEKTNQTSFCTPFLKLPLQFFFSAEIQTFQLHHFQKGEQKQSGVSFYGITCAVCQVKFFWLLFSLKSPYTDFFDIFSMLRNSMTSSNFMISSSSLHTSPSTQLAPYIDYPLWTLLTVLSAKVYKTYSCQFSKQKLLLFCIGNNNLLLMSQYLLFHLIVFSVICIYLKRINPLVFYKQVQDLLV